MSALTLWALFVLLPALDNAGLLGALGVVLTFIAFMLACFADDENDPGLLVLHGFASRNWKRWGIASCALILVGTAAPDERQVYTIAGAYVVTNIEGVERLPANMVKAANAFLERVADAAENK